MNRYEISYRMTPKKNDMLGIASVVVDAENMDEAEEIGLERIHDVWPDCAYIRWRGSKLLEKNIDTEDSDDCSISREAN